MVTNVNTLMNDAFDLDKMVADIKQWAAIESPSSDASAVNTMVDMVQEKFASMGFTTQRFGRLVGEFGQPVGDMLVAQSPRDYSNVGSHNEKGIFICSHVDTVHPVGELANNPIRTEGDKLYGPGVYDMKASAYMAMTACDFVARAKTGHLPITYLIVPDEEIGSHASREKIKELAAQNKYCLVTEPARDGGKIVIARRGTGDIFITVHGVAAHAGSKFTVGRNALIETATNIIPKLLPLVDINRGCTVSPNVIQSGEATNKIPDLCKLSIDLRADYTEDMKRIVDTIYAIKPSSDDFTYDIVGGFNRPPWPVGEKHNALFHHAKEQADQLGFELVGIQTGGGSDGNFSAEIGIPTLDGLGMNGENAHTSDEYGYISSIIPRTALMVRLLETLK